MIVVVETGIGLEDANSYIDNTFLDGYFSAGRKTVWDKLSQEDQDAMLVSATQFIDLSYKWIGNRKSHEQGLHWPRTNAYYPDTEHLIDGVPKAVSKATAEVVAMLISDDPPERLFKVLEEERIRSEKMAVIQTEYFEKKTEIPDGETAYTLINLILEGLYQADQKQSGIQTVKVLRV